ncbi:AraC family transcriptional regulator [Pasteurellaceae bacterium USgator11]|nr:AraC family transcriptional regulator [Pasteurellaceae bacterium USgator41]TNG94074.1 AraC family transcriptional regulator [Pasteurellaceae bacterium UScroc12]TNG97910.1 AraC family transcriptional regulator [Pasteurellaceae bacterium UScroc31]TNH02046.1 AraC family transcriptional regulator [Pasteurellaceae bacterium USgator11]
MDPLAEFFTRFDFRSDLFFSSLLCRIGEFNEPNKSYLHIVHQGAFDMMLSNHVQKRVYQPCAIFCPNSTLHRLNPLDENGISVSCISFDFGEGVTNPLNQALDECVIMPLNQHPELSALSSAVYQEYHSEQPGKAVSIHHLCAYFLIRVIRYGLQQQQLTSGFLCGLCDAKLGKVLTALHQKPAEAWQLDNMAELANMSRSNFAAHFKKVIGISAMDYLTQWRLTLAQRKIRSGLPIALVAEEVGYQYASAFSRIFTAKIGLSPLKWLAKQQQSDQ